MPGHGQPVERVLQRVAGGEPAAVAAGGGTLLTEQRKQGVDQGRLAGPVEAVDQQAQRAAVGVVGGTGSKS
ncbi:hypothetical protein [Kitasatospora sp. NPDC059599]|uniref:hypothetical protein n=1 Tax=Kitasatospora sp. NPDC059599 TaxID=3346880 RepID=UPI00367B20F4